MRPGVNILPENLRKISEKNGKLGHLDILTPDWCLGTASCTGALCPTANCIFWLDASMAAALLYNLALWWHFDILLKDIHPLMRRIYTNSAVTAISKCLIFGEFVKKVTSTLLTIIKKQMNIFFFKLTTPGSPWMKCWQYSVKYLS